MQVRELLAMLDLGNSVAEFDEQLADYFVETPTFKAIVGGTVDIIAGDKGTGKTALFRVLVARYRRMPELKDVEVIPAFNASGNAVFQRLGQLGTMTEAQYVGVWKSYILSLVGNWLLETIGEDISPNFRSLGALLSAAGLRSPDPSAQTIFSKIITALRRWAHPKSLEVGVAVTEHGWPILVPKIEFEPTKTDTGAPGPEVISFETAFGALNRCLEETGTAAWVVLDRLDEAFQGFEDVERPALRALLRTYLDLVAFPNVRLKLFVRKDLFRKVVAGGFVNLTHVNAKRLDIVWEEQDLLSLLCRRIRRNTTFIERLSGPIETDQQLFERIFPPKVDIGSRKPTTWAWIMTRIRDGNSIRPPRNLIDLSKKALEAQARAEDRAPREYQEGVSLVEPDALRKALQRLSEDRVYDTLLAEAADLAPMIEKFRDGKAEQNEESLSRLLNLPTSDVKKAVAPLVELGFLEEVGSSFKVPQLYRDGLRITQGKAFAADDGEDE